MVPPLVGQAEVGARLDTVGLGKDVKKERWVPWPFTSIPLMSEGSLLVLSWGLNCKQDSASHPHLWWPLISGKCHFRG
jgi:hypothetical protein